MDVSVRVGVADDHTELLRLVETAVAEQRVKRGGALWARTADRAVDPARSLHDDLGDEGVCVLVATIDDVPLGYGVGHTVRLADGGLLAVVTDLYVEPDARGVGLGEALMNDLVAWATEAGCFGIDSEALPGDRHTKNFFESFGLVARALTVHRELG